MSRRPRKQINQMNVVPYIDVMLVLLIIFMVTAPLINPGEIELPSVGMQTSTPQEPLEVTLKQDKSMQLRDRAGSAPGIRVNNEQLVARVRDALEANPRRAVVISADKNVPYGEVVRVLDLLKQNRVERAGLLVQSVK
jgi:biopolymer transport protein TolR